MSAIDWLIVLTIVLSIALGVLRGVVRELIAVIGWVAAVVLAIHYAAALGTQMPDFIEWPAVRTGIAALLIILAIIFLSGAIGWVVQRLISAAKLSATDRALGACFGLLRGILLVGVFSFFLYQTELAQQAWWKKSILLPRIEVALDYVAPHVSVPRSWLPSVKQPAARDVPPSST